MNVISKYIIEMRLRTLYLLEAVALALTYPVMIGIAMLIGAIPTVIIIG